MLQPAAEETGQSGILPAGALQDPHNPDGVTNRTRWPRRPGPEQPGKQGFGPLAAGPVKRRKARQVGGLNVGAALDEYPDAGIRPSLPVPFGSDPEWCPANPVRGVDCCAERDQLLHRAGALLVIHRNEQRRDR